LRLDELEVRHLRCFAHWKGSFAPGINWIWGENGSGKTTLLEAVHLIGRGRSFRVAAHAPLVRKGEEAFFVRARMHRFGPVHIELHGTAARLGITIQGVRAPSRVELARTLPVVVDSPQGMRIVEGEAAVRRRWLDALTSLLIPAANESRRRFLRAWMQWARALRTGKDALAWIEPIVHWGRAWMRHRERIVAELNAQLRKELWAGEVSLWLAPLPKDEDWKDALHKATDASRCPGPHRCALEVRWQGRDARHLASRGQQRICAFALRLSECGLVARHLGITPLVLFDDALDALDRKRTKLLLDRLSRYPGQVWITTPEPPRGCEHAVELKEER